METFNNNKENNKEELPQVVVEEANDKPAARGIWLTIIIVLFVLGIIYFIFFKH